jgi:hypothetical protein
MHEPCFVVAAQIDCTCYANTLSDTNYNSYTIIDSKFVCKNNLECIPISSCSVSGFERNPEIIETVVCFSLDISSNYQQIV